MQDDPGLWETEIGHLSLILKTKDVIWMVLVAFYPPTAPHYLVSQWKKIFFFY